MLLKPVHWIQTESALRAQCDLWKSAPVLAVDTEFMRTDTFFPIPALIQVHDGTGSFLIDPQQLKELAPFVEVLRSETVAKVMHSCSEDLEVFHHLTGELPARVLDTQIAAALCGYGFSVGYANLVEKLLGVTLPKGETRSDWLQRPLTPAQENYAALDVEFLFVVAEQLLAKLAELDRLSWLDHEYQVMAQRFHEMQHPDKACDRLKGAGRLKGRSLLALQTLASWREIEARNRNIPRGRVLNDSAMYDLAGRMPTNTSQLHGFGSIHASTIRKFGEQIIAILDKARTAEPASLPQNEAQLPLDSGQRALVKKLREKIALEADKCAVAPELLAKRSDYEFIARAISQGVSRELWLPPSLSSWRTEALNRALQDVS